MNRASTSKKSRRAARVSLRPNPSVPSACSFFGSHWSMASGSTLR